MSSELQIPRPEDKNKRKMYYSGKKKRRTVESQLVVNNRDCIIHKAIYQKEKA
jgi:hypothetical protein